MKGLIVIICVVMLISTSMLSGCSWLGSGVDYATNVIDLKVESTLIKQQYEQLYVLVDGKRDSFTEEEWTQLMDVHFAFSESALRIERMMSNPKEVITPAELKQMYELAYIGYTNARDIISTHKDVFTSYQWAQMVRFDEKCIEYDAKVRNILDNPDTVDINKTLGLILTLGGVAYKYLLPVLVSII